jgi:hypothetical protein
MKKFLMYVIVLVVMLFVGYTTYYFVRNNENIYLTLAEEDRTIYMNVDESYDLPIVWTKPYSSTKVYENVTIDNEGVVTFDVTSKKFVAKTGGTCRVTVTPSNTRFGPFMFTIAVGDGTVTNPYFLRTEDDLKQVGKGSAEKWQLTNSYRLTSDIDLRRENFAPIGSQATPFSGTFDGNGHAISNMTVTSGNDAGLFAVLSPSAVVENLTLSKVTFSGEFDNVGAVAGICRGTVRSVRVENLSISNTKADSNNGSLVGSLLNYSSNGEFVSFGYVEMSCATSVNAQTSGVFGGIAGRSTGSVIYNCYTDIKTYTQNENSTAFGGLVGSMSNAENTSTYMFSVIKNCYTLIGTVNLSQSATAVLGTVAGTNSDVTTETSNNKFIGIYTHTTGNALNAIGADSGNADVSDIFEKSNTADLQKKATYVGYNFKDVWTIEEDASMAELLPFDEVISQPLGIYIPGQAITNLDDLKDVITGVTNNPGNGKTFEIENNIVWDLDGAEWHTIAPQENNPLTASFICKDGVTVTIKNFRLTNQNNSVFGYISGQNTQIKGFIFEKVTVDSNEEVVAVVATALLNNATLDSIQVKNANMSTGADNRYLAVVVGKNNGKVINAKVNDGVFDQNTVSSESQSLILGGIVAYNTKVVDGCTIEMYNFEPNTTSTSATLKFGGVVGVNTSTVRNSQNYDASLSLTYYGEAYAGGVVGYMEGGSISKCFSEGLISLPYTNSKTYVGGVVAYAGVSSITQSYYANQTLQGCNVAGIVQTSYANVSQCYFQGEAKGMRVAGLVGINNKTLTNSYVLGILEGMQSGANVSGIASWLPKESLVDHCFSSATFKGYGTHHAETESEFRANAVETTVGSWFDSKYAESGELRNCIIVNYGSANVKVTMFSARPGWIDCSDAQAKGLEGSYSVFTKTAGFDQDLWTFDNHEGAGGYPTLTYVAVNPHTTED